MNIFMGYNFLSDGNSLDPYVRNIGAANSVTIMDGIYHHLNMTKDVTSAYSSAIPTSWTNDTLMDCNFEGNLNAGSISSIVANVSSVKIKRREQGTYEWITIDEISVTDPSQLSFVVRDYLCGSNREYEYAFVPCFASGTEGDYITATVETKFRGVFICDTDTAYRFYSGVEYDSTASVQKVGTFEPFGRKYPVYVANGITQYQSGSVSGDVLPTSFYSSQDKTIDRNAVRRERDAMMSFLTNRKPKILKDHNGNVWLVVIVGSPSTSYENSFGQGFLKASASWMEIGAHDDKEDLYNAGMIPTAN